MEAIFGGVALTGPTPSEQLGVVDLPTSLLAEVVPVIRAASPLLKVRGNESLSVRLRCVRRYASLLDAMAARATFMRSLARSGQLELTQESGGMRLTLLAEEAVRAPSPGPVLAGRAVEWEFVFLVKEFLPTFDEVAEFLRDEGGELITDQNGSPIYY